MRRKSNIYTVREILRVRHGIEQGPVPDEETEYYWLEILKGCLEQDAIAAVWRHYRVHNRPLFPADVLLLAKSAAADRDPLRLDRAQRHS